MMLSGIALDRLGTARLIPLYQLPLIVGFAVFSMSGSLLHVAIGFMFLGLTTGANSTLPNAFWAEFYGTRNIGSIKAMATAVMVLGSALGPGVTGVLIDIGVPLTTQFMGIAFYFAFASTMVWVGIQRTRRSLPNFA